jgi:alpha-beta hydrolase superfamily lysophospholipase
MGFQLRVEKPTYPKVYLSFVHAIFEAQKEIHAGVQINVPTLVMHSHKTPILRNLTEMLKALMLF